MGLIRKLTSVSTLGAVDFRSDKERIAKNTRKTRVAVERSNELAQRRLQLDEERLEMERAEQSSQDRGEHAMRSSLAGELRSLAEMHRDGLLDDDEFVVAKRRLLEASD